MAFTFRVADVQPVLRSTRQAIAAPEVFDYFFKNFAVLKDFEMMKKKKHDGRMFTDKKLEENIIEIDPKIRRLPNVKYLFLCPGSDSSGDRFTPLKLTHS